MASKPTIASPVFEYDTRLGHGLSQADMTTVAVWPDQSGQSNNAVQGAGTPEYLLTGWDANIPAIQLLTGENFDWSGGAALNNTNMTLFFVIEATDISQHIAVIGSVASIAFPRRVTVIIKPDGAILFTFSCLAPGCVISGTGVVKDGDRIIIAVRFSTTTGMLIRVQKKQVAVNAGQTTAQIDIGTPTLGFSKDDQLGFGIVTGVDKLYTWASAYASAASDSEISSMEAFLFQEFFGTVWGSCAPNPGTVWGSC